MSDLYVAEEWEEDGFRVRIIADPEPIDPRKNYDHAAVMVCAHDRYELGDEQVRGNLDIVQYLSGVEGVKIIDKRDGRELDENYGEWFHQDDEDCENAVPDEFLEIKGVEFMLLWLYDHSGISMSVSNFDHIDSARWDSGIVGIIYMAQAQMDEDIDVNSDWAKEYHPGKTQVEIAREMMRGEVKEYDQFLTGDVYGYVIDHPETCEHCKHTENPVDESCWGFFGEEYAKEEAKRVLESLKEKK